MSDTTEGQLFDVSVRLSLLEQRVESDYHQILESVTELHFRLDVTRTALRDLQEQIYLIRFLVSHIISQADTTDLQSEPIDLDSLD